MPNECPKCHSKNIEKLNTSVDKQELDYDVDALEKYNPGVIMPEYIFFKDGKEIKRLVGEHKKEEFIEILESEK